MLKKILVLLLLSAPLAAGAIVHQRLDPGPGYLPSCVSRQTADGTPAFSVPDLPATAAAILDSCREREAEHRLDQTIGAVTAALVSALAAGIVLLAAYVFGPSLPRPGEGRAQRPRRGA